MLTYRPDIDGLRAIAVLSVLFYHLDESLLSGGFVGVDIFFVISGYLITKLIAKERRDTGRFSYSRFYVRRIRRLFPALFATLVLSTLAAAWLLSPAHLVEYGESAIASVLSLSNLYFWNSVDYFDSASQLKPLLHTWSLSVEEQFYLIWPALLVFLLSFRHALLVPLFILVMAVASLVLNIAVFSHQADIAAWFGRIDNQAEFSAQATAFYWLPFRVFEFAIGALLVFLPELKTGGRNPARELLFAAGLAMIVFALLNLNSKTEFPSTAALWPCLGAALMMLAGPQHRLVWMVSNRAAVSIGLISYSLYLLHWPIIVFLRYRNFEAPDTLEKLAIVVISIGLAAFFYKFIEQPFRRPGRDSNHAPNKRFLTGSAVSALLLIAISWHASASGGWLNRYPKDVVAQLSFQRGDYSEYFWRSFFRLEKSFSNSGKPKVLVIGDSMAADFVNVIIEGGHEQEFDLSTIAIGDNCKVAFPLTDEQYSSVFAGAAEICRQQNQKIWDRMNDVRAADAIVLASYWREPFWPPYVAATSKFLRENTDAEILVSGLKDQISNGIWFLNKHAFAPNIHRLRTPVNPQIVRANHGLREGNSEFHYFDLLDLFCAADGCQRVTEDGYVIVFDQSHFSERGAQFIGQRIANTPWFKLLKSSASSSNGSKDTHLQPRP